MKKILLSAILIIIFCSCSSNTFLPSRKEVNELELIRVIGIDKGKKKQDLIRVTISSKRQEESKSTTKEDSKNSTSDNILVMTAEGKTAFETARKFQDFSNKEIFWGHTEFFILGENAAKDNIVKHLDLLTRGQELRLNSTVYIAKEATAEELIELTSNSSYFIVDILKGLSDNYKLTSNSGKIEMIELIGNLDDKHSDLVIPALKIHMEKENSKNFSLAEAKLSLDGYAIIKDNKLIAYADKPQSMGINLITNKFISGTISVNDTEKEEIALEVVQAKTKLKPEFKDDELTSITITVFIDSNIAEIHSERNIFNEKELQHIKKMQASAVKKYIYDVIKLAQDYESDFLGIGNKIFHMHPIKWDKIKDEWKNNFKNVDFRVEVKSKILRTYDIQEPNRYKAGD